jgi:uncharacterized protein YcbX
MTRRPACSPPRRGTARLRRRPARRTAGRRGFEAWLADLLGDEVQGPLRVIEGPGDYRFMDSRSGYVSIVNLASVRDLGERWAGRSIRCASAPTSMSRAGRPGSRTTGPADDDRRRATAEVLKPIVRCAATHVDPVTAERDIELVKALFDLYGHMFCGIYEREGGAERGGA